MKKLPALLLLILACLTASAAPDKSSSKTPAASAPVREGDLDPVLRARIDSCFIFMKEGKAGEAYQKLFENSSIVKDQPELMQELTTHTERVLQKCGKVESSSITRVRSAGRTLREIICTVNCQKRPLRYIIYAYHGEGRWQVIDTKVDSELDAFFPRD